MFPFLSAVHRRWKYQYLGVSHSGIVLQWTHDPGLQPDRAQPKEPASRDNGVPGVGNNNFVVAMREISPASVSKEQ